MSTMCAGEPLTCSTRSQILREPMVRGAALGLCAAVIWGSYLALAKAGVNAGLGASDIALLRYGVAALVLLPWLITHGPSDFSRVGWWRWVSLTLLAGPLFVLIGVGGYKFAPLAHGAMFQPAGLIVGGVAFAALVLHERSPAQRLVGVIIMLLGLAFLAGPGLLSATSMTPIGDAMFFSAGMMWAGFSILTKRWSISALMRLLPVQSKRLSRPT
jgi:drug/metabolite transporter (DMT)-like permease